MTDELTRYLAIPGSRVQLVERSAEPAAFIARLVAAASWLHLIHVPQPEGTPRLTVTGTSAHGEMMFRGPIEGRVAEALAVLVRSLATSEVDYDTPATPQVLRELKVKVALGVHVSPTCAFCPAVVAAALRFAQATGWIDVLVNRADLEPFPGQRSVPTVVADGEVISTGSIGEYELAERLVQHLTGGRV